MRKILIAGFALIAAMTSCSGAMTTTYTATLLGSSQVPPVITSNQTQATATATLDSSSSVLTVSGTYAYLSGQVTAQHIRGPVAAGAVAPIVFTLTNTATAAAGSFEGKFTLSASQITDLNSGLYYINLETAQNPSGEVRGQLIK
jgi:CHRD domain